MLTVLSRAMAQFSEVTAPGRWLVDSLPFLRHLPSFVPGTGFKKIAAEYFDVTEELADTPLAFCQEQIVRRAA